MTKLSTLFFLVNESERLSAELIGWMDKMDDVQSLEMSEENEEPGLLKAPERAVKNIIGFTHAHTVVHSKNLDYIDLYKN